MKAAKPKYRFGLYGNLPTTTANQSRLQLFQPTRRPITTVRRIETAWGNAIVHGKIGQAHADVMEAIFKEALEYQIIEDGGMQILVDPYKVRVTAGGGNAIGGSQLNKVLIELMQVVIDMHIKDKDIKIKGHILEWTVDSKVKANVRAATSFGGEDRRMWCVKIPASFVQFFYFDHCLYYDPRPIAALMTGIGQAIARHVATHNSQPLGGWVLDKLIKAVGAGETSTDIRNRRREIQKDAGGLLYLGLKIQDGRMQRVKGKHAVEDPEQGV
jgi:hypothetical protein